MIKVKTESGFECEINENVLDDVEILEVFAELDDGNLTHIATAARKLLRGEYKRLCDHIRTTDDRVPLSDLAREMTDIIDKFPEAKK